MTRAAPVLLERWAPGPQVDTIDLLSDVHLSPTMPRTAAAWRRHLTTTPAQAIVILGDLFEAWVGDDAGAVAGSFEAEQLAALATAARTREAALMVGNRDFLLGPALLAAHGVQALQDPCELQAFGQCWLLSHGDAQCLADVDYQRFRAIVRSPEWQAGFLAQPLHERMRQAAEMRDASRQHQAGRTDWPDVDPDEIERQLDKHAGCRGIVHGHTHRPGDHAVAAGRSRLVLGDWDLDHAAPRASVLRLTRAGWQRLDPSAWASGSA